MGPTMPAPARVAGWLLLTALGCALEGDGSGGDAPTIRLANTESCLTITGGFPSGFAPLPGAGDEAVVVQFIPTLVLGLSLDREPPRLLADRAVPGFPLRPCGRCGGLESVDSDSDGEADVCRSDALGFGCLPPRAGSVEPIERDWVALSTSSYEQVVFADPRTGALRKVELETPAAGAGFDPADWPFWPPVGETPLRSALSTRACVYLPGGLDSLGDPLGTSRFCDPSREGFVTTFTAGATVAAERLFVATSNLQRPSQARYAPGTVLVFELDRSVDPPRLRPHPSRPIVLTTRFNPTTVVGHRTPAGRELVLIGASGAIALGTGDDLVRTESAIDVLDATTLETIATIPLGRAGLGFSDLAIDESGRIALTGAATSRALFGIDLAVLDDPSLGDGSTPLPVVLDGSTPGWPDARVFDATDPFQLPKRVDGPSDSSCTTQTAVALGSPGTRGVASDFCDGTLTVLTLHLPALRSTPLDPATVLEIERLEVVAAPLVDDATAQPRAIDRPLIRPGRPGVDFDGPDVHFTAGRPEGAVCGARIDAL